MRDRILHALRRLVRPEPKRRLCAFERRRIMSMIDAGASYGTIVREHGYTRGEVDLAISAHTGRISDA